MKRSEIGDLQNAVNEVYNKDWFLGGKKGLTPSDIRRQLSEICGKKTPSCRFRITYFVCRNL
jgi:hypothetical protein